MIKATIKNLFARFQAPDDQDTWRVMDIICRAPPAGFLGYDHTKAETFAACDPMERKAAPGQASNMTIALKGYDSLRDVQRGDIVTRNKATNRYEVVGRVAGVAA